jgi:hypothetical protein
MLDRRTFLRRLGFGTMSAAAAVCTFDIEKLLWVPGEKTIILPIERCVRDGGNTFITPEWLTRETAALWKKNISLAAYFDAEYDGKPHIVPMRYRGQTQMVPLKVTKERF